MDKKRTVAQDAAKGIMILGVVFFHCFLMSFTDYKDSIKQFNLFMAFFPFIMGAFFFYSGYNYQNNGRSYKENILRRVKQLLIPMVIAFAISVVLISSMELIYNHNDVGLTFQRIGNSILMFLMSEPLAIMIGFPSPESAGVVFELLLSLGLLWFLYALFICSIFFYLLVNYTNKKLSRLISVVALLLISAFCLGQFVGPYLPYTVQSYPVILAIMLTGAYLRQSHFLNRRIKSKKDIVFKVINTLVAEGLIVGICLLMYYAFGALSTGSLPGGQFDATLRGFDAFTGYAFAILGTYFIHTTCRLIKRIPVVGATLAWLGNHTATFYLFHPIFLDFYAIVVFQKQIKWGRWQALFYLVVVVASLSLLCFLLDLLFTKKKIKRPIAEDIKNNEAPDEVENEPNSEK